MTHTWLLIQTVSFLMKVHLVLQERYSLDSMLYPAGPNQLQTTRAGKPAFCFTITLTCSNVLCWTGDRVPQSAQSESVRQLCCMQTVLYMLKHGDDWHPVSLSTSLSHCHADSSIVRLHAPNLVSTAVS